MCPGKLQDKFSAAKIGPKLIIGMIGHTRDLHGTHAAISRFLTIFVS